jgi:filamentous hemagglutinin
LNAAIDSYATAGGMNNARLSAAGNKSVTAELNQNVALSNDPKLAQQTLLDSFKEFALPQAAGYAAGAVIGKFIGEAQAVYSAIKAEASAVPGALASGGAGVKAGATGGIVEPIVTARGTINGTVFDDVNQSAKIGVSNEPTLIADRIAAKVEAKGKPFPNGTVADSHAEIGVIQQAYDAGKTQGSGMLMNVTGKDVCGYCKGDIAAAADAAGLNSLTVKSVDEAGVSRTYYWQPGMKSIKEKP